MERDVGSSLGKHIRRRDFITFLGCLTVWPTAAGAQKGRTVPLIGVLWHAGSADEEAPYLQALRQGLSDLGCIEGQNIILENRLPAEIPYND
jgi:putative tryptophan/tyrosine transport system substrate-binding protein